MRRAVSIAAVAIATLGGWSACKPCETVESPRTPVGACARACRDRAAKNCSEHECSRGCTFVLDRLVEHEGERILACVARAPATAKCDDALWADCAVRIGEHADGGPPPPPPPPEE